MTIIGATPEMRANGSLDPCTHAVCGRCSSRELELLARISSLEQQLARQAHEAEESAQQVSECMTAHFALQLHFSEWKTLWCVAVARGEDTDAHVWTARERAHGRVDRSTVESLWRERQDLLDEAEDLKDELRKFTDTEAERQCEKQRLVQGLQTVCRLAAECTDMLPPPPPLDSEGAHAAANALRAKNLARAMRDSLAAWRLSLEQRVAVWQSAALLCIRKRRAVKQQCFEVFKWRACTKPHNLLTAHSPAATLAAGQASALEWHPGRDCSGVLPTHASTPQPPPPSTSPPQLSSPPSHNTPTRTLEPSRGASRPNVIAGSPEYNKQIYEGHLKLHLASVKMLARSPSSLEPALRSPRIERFRQLISSIEFSGRAAKLTQRAPVTTCDQTRHQIVKSVATKTGAEQSVDGHKQEYAVSILSDHAPPLLRARKEVQRHHVDIFLKPTQNSARPMSVSSSNFSPKKATPRATSATPKTGIKSERPKHATRQPLGFSFCVCV